MILDDPTTLVSLAALDVALYGAAVGGFLRARRAAFRAADSERAFFILEGALRKAFPDLPEGFTWREALHKVESLEIEVNWTEVGRALKQYEDWRYGEDVKKEEVNPEVMHLARELSRRGRRWPRV